MIRAVAGAWALFAGMFLLMLGNGMQGTLLGIRGPGEGFSTAAMSVVMSAYFAGFLGGSWLTPSLIRRVGHVRVFAALGSLISAALILYPTITEPLAWIALRVLIGFCFSGVYVTAESWLNESATNATRGKTLSAYMIVQMSGVVAAQYVVALGDPSGFVMFIIPSVLVSLSFAPILLSAQPVPPFESDRTLSLTELYRVSPTGMVGMFLVGVFFAAQFGMAALYATLAGFGVGQTAIFVSAFYVGGLILQFPIGLLSDRIDRRRIILACAIAGSLSAVAALLAGDAFALLCLAALAIGGASNPLYSLLIAYTNDYLDPRDMPAASGGLMFLNGVGAIFGPLLAGGLISALGPAGFFAMIAGVLGCLSAYVAWRMTRRESVWDAETSVYQPMTPTATAVALSAAQEVYVEAAAEGEETGDEVDRSAA